MMHSVNINEAFVRFIWAYFPLKIEIGWEWKEETPARISRAHTKYTNKFAEDESL